jgi:L,D-transpeptidase ErfK/SrfK
MNAVKFAFVAAIFITFSPSAWSAYGAQLCKQDAFECYTVKKNDSWKKLFPDETKRDLVMRINRININLYRGMKIAIPKDLATATMMDYAPMPKQISAPGERYIYVSLDPKVLAWGAYDETGTLKFWGPVSGGRGWCPDVGRGCNTATGKFHVYQKQGRWCVSSKFPIGRGGAPMPYCMFFRGGFALHGSYEVPGYNASHGCVRMFIPDARWLNEDFVSDDENVAVIVERASN